MRNPIRKRYDPNYITVLSENYRSHRDILEIPNELFYGGMLQAKGDIGRVNSIFKIICQLKTYYIFF